VAWIGFSLGLNVNDSDELHTPEPDTRSAGNLSNLIASKPSPRLSRAAHSDGKVVKITVISYLTGHGKKPPGLKVLQEGLSVATPRQNNHDENGCGKSDHNPKFMIQRQSHRRDYSLGTKSPASPQLETGLFRAIRGGLSEQLYRPKSLPLSACLR